MERVEEKELINDEMSQTIVDTAERIVRESGVEAVTVRRILGELGITNRVFYNRFKNIGEVLNIVYTKTAKKIREGLEPEYDGSQDFFEYVTELVVHSLVLSYEIKKKFNQYVFEGDSASQSSYDWYLERIKKWFAYAKEKKLIKDIDEDTMGYAIWCFCRGYNADAVMRMPKEEAVEKLKYAFGFLLEGIKRREDDEK